MDGVSTAIGLIANGYKAVKFIKAALDDIKNAPRELQALHQRVDWIELHLRQLEEQHLENVFRSEQDIRILKYHGNRTQECLGEVSRFVREMEKSGDKFGDEGVKKIKWLMKKTRLSELNGQLDRLESMLSSVMGIVVMQSQSQAMLKLQGVSLVADQTQLQVAELRHHIDDRISHSVVASTYREWDVSSAGTAVRLPTGSPNTRQKATFVPPSHAHYASFSERLKCPPQCSCRCHAPFTQSLLPSSLMPYIGRVNVSKRLLHVLGLSSWECNAQTCRRDRTAPHTINWCLPLSVVRSEWFMQFKLPSLCVSIHAPRLIPNYAEVWDLIHLEDLTGLQELFEARAASIYDVDEGGATLLAMACNQWGRSRSDDAQKIVRFLAEAGADLDFEPGQNVSAKTTLFYTSVATLVKHPMSTFARQIQTDSISIDICQSVFGIDMSDVFMDVLEQQSNGEKLQAALGFSTPSSQLDSSLDRDSALEQLTGFSLLDYSIHYMTLADALHTLENGADASHGVPMAMAAYRGHNDLLHPLLDAGADVNAIDEDGFLALHWACYFGSVDTLNILIDLADNSIDWDARTQDGKNMTALQLAKASSWWHRHPPSWRDEMLAILHEHGLEDDDEEDGPLRMPGGLD